MCLDYRKKEKTLDRKIKGQKNTYSDCVRPSSPADASVIFLSLYFSVQFSVPPAVRTRWATVVFLILIAAEGRAG